MSTERDSSRKVQVIIQEEKDSILTLLIALSLVIFCSFQIGKIIGEDPESIENISMLENAKKYLMTVQKKKPAIQLNPIMEIANNNAVQNNPPSISLNRKVQLTKAQILSDQSSKISMAFDIPKNLKKRVGFWFDIYTRYDSKKHIIHHVKYPWIIFEVVDVSPFFKRKKNYWTNYHASKRYLNKRKARIKYLLKDIAKTKNYKKLSKEQKRFVEQMSRLTKNQRQIIRNAYKNIRSQTGQKNHYLAGIKRLNAYKHKMEQIFSQYDLPSELIRIPLVESSFNINAVSKVGASGVWQFMPNIGKRFLKINKYIDERNSPLKATSAAAKLLRENFINLQSWPLAVSAYNHGPGLLRKASRAVKSKDLGTMILKYNSRSFGFASKNFYASFLAALYAEKYKTEIFGNIKLKAIYKVKKVRLEKSLRLKSIFSRYKIHPNKFLALNPDIKKTAVRQNARIPKGITIYL